MSYRHYAAAAPLLIGLDPFYVVAEDHLARLVVFIVEETVKPKPHAFGQGQRPFDPRLCVKVLMLGYATGVRSSRALERLCDESLPYMLLTRGDTPSYRTLCFARIKLIDELEAAFIGLFAIADELGMRCIGRLTIDATKIRANASTEAVIRANEFEAVKAELSRILAEAESADAQEDIDASRCNGSRIGTSVDEDPAVREQMRDILRRVRKSRRANSETSSTASDPELDLNLPSAASNSTTSETSSAASDPELDLNLPSAASNSTTSETSSAVSDPELELNQPSAASSSTTSEASFPAAADPELELNLPATESCSETLKVKDSQLISRHTPEMLRRILAAVAAIEQAEKDGLGHLCLTDPDARMMAEGREKQLRERHSFEAATDAGLLVAGQSTQVNNDNKRLPVIIAAAETHEPGGVSAVTADSGYYGGDIISGLIDRNIDTCVPDSHTTCDLHRGPPVGTTRRNFLKRQDLASAGFVYDEASDHYTCAEGHVLSYRQQRKDNGQTVRVYIAEADCQSCRLAHQCLLQKNASHRTLKVSTAHSTLEADRLRFLDPEHQDRYRHRGEQIETVFAVIRAKLGYTRWLLRGAKRVQHEARLFKLGYQLRKIHSALEGRKVY